MVGDGSEARSGQASSDPEWFSRSLAVPFERRMVDVSGCPIHYLSWGDRGDPGLLLVPPSGGHAHWFSHIAALFADQFHVVAMDPSGCGDSGRRNQYSNALITQEIMAVATDAGMLEADAAPTLVGHSAGAQSVIRAAIAHGEMLLGVIAVDGIRYAALEKDHAIKALSGPRPSPRPPRIHQDHRQALASFRLTPTPLRPIEDRYVLDHIARHSIMPVDGGWMSKFDPTQAAVITLGMELKDELANLPCHAAVLYAEHTHLADETAAAAITAATGGRVGVFTIPGSTHYPMIDSPLTFVAAVKGISLTWRTVGGRVRADRAAD